MTPSLEITSPRLIGDHLARLASPRLALVEITSPHVSSENRRKCKIKDPDPHVALIEIAETPDSHRPALSVETFEQTKTQRRRPIDLSIYLGK